LNQATKIFVKTGRNTAGD